LRKRKNLEIGYKLLDDNFPSDKTLDEDIGRLEIMRGNIFLDERLASRDGGALLARPGYGGGARDRRRVVHGCYGEENAMG
jgi:hypothetical protein